MAGLPQPGFMDFQEPDEATLIRRIEAIERAQRELGPAVMGAIGPQVAALTAQQATLTAQQATLTSQVASIATLTANQVTGTTHTASSAYGWTSFAAGGDYATLTVTVPAGYTRAVLAVSVDVLFSAVTSPPWSGEFAARIAGVNGASRVFSQDSSTAYMGTGSASHALSLTGLTGGSTFNASTRIVSATGSSLQLNATTTVTAIWLK